MGLLLFLTLASCVSPPMARLEPYPPFTCESFTEHYWQEFSFGAESADTLDDVVARIAELWHLDSSQVQTEQLSEKGVAIQWQVVFPDGADPRYSARFHEELRLTSILFMWWYRKPTLAQVLECLGTPEFYAAYYEQGVEAHALKLHLWYVDKGYVVQGASFHHEEQPPSIGPEYRMRYFNATVPGDLERMLSTMYNIKPAVLAGFLCLTRPWPGSIEKIEVESLLVTDPQCKFY